MAAASARAQAEAKVIEKATADAEFRARLLANPKAAVGELGIGLPEQLDLRIVEEDATTIYLVLPPTSAEALTDEERAEMAATDPRAREILERTEALTPEQLMALHGTIREFGMSR